MRLKFTFLVLIPFLFLGFAPIKPKILVFTKTAGYHHASIPLGVAAITKLGQENGFSVDTTSDDKKFTESNLKKYSAVVFLSTTGDLLTATERNDFERYIQAGGGYVGIHAAADANYDWHWYGRLVGGYFVSHPAQQEAVLHVVDKTHISTKHLPDTWKRKDEWYNYKDLVKDLHVLITIDETSYTGGINGSFHPMAWYHNYDGGRAWYTELGHVDESYSDPLFLKHILGGIQWAIGDHVKLNYAKVTTERIPEENRFVKTQLITGTFFEPTELTVLPNLDILITQRRGEILLYKNDTKKVKQAGFLDAYWKAHVKGVNAEEGVLGIQADPDFKNNHYIYIYYSPADTSVNRLSRFTFVNDTIDNKTEKIVLQLYSQREICCHTGGSIAFGPDNMLFLSTGDNSTPFDEDGNPPYNTHAFAPLDDRPGFDHYDSRRSAGNTNDLRGKILRIKMKPDGTYDIPEGNLFKPGQPKTRPEIYVMGDRNPYRISVDKKNSNLYWGEVGPDANNDSLATRGPRGYDEFNQARKAGFFGWPLFIGPNISYHEYNYATGVSGPAFDPAKPINNSKNNTGLPELPPAQPAMIWYPYAASPEFPEVGSGGRTTMAGPIYYTDLYPKATRFPDYYNSKVIFYDWIRGWIKAITLQPNGDFDKMEPFMPSTKFNAPIDMEAGPDGRIYVLEYGNGWFQKNPDAGLARIDYNRGNRAPEISKVNASKTYGALPLTVVFTVAAKDPEGDKMSYTWNLGNGVTKKTVLPKLIYTYTKKGNYNATVDVADDQAATVKSKLLNITPGSMVSNMSNIGANSPGKALMMTLDCKTCHKVAEKSIGPAFTEVAKKYPNNKASMAHLTQKVINGGTGVWGDVSMPAHPALKPAEAKQIIGWILSLKQ
ncbi:ThuA domain-containing protein [Mucilaginibacter sp. BJC16-A38]|uniref:ThuA domain-containing protein n=1 Tax=Mucilaginibacter phenanthrenivorans TaxID=1234842 RepID=UPI002157612F|nr:ThuA domain-containing protein [Mucilaginibacter phenanthrenivorans]MCR8559787.1 ThuA domain-containing protein [Mucilaginibacter phenanthrenivorans]